MKITKEQFVLAVAVVYLIFVVSMIWVTIINTPGNPSQTPSSQTDSIETVPAEQQGIENNAEYGNLQIIIPGADASNAGSTFDGVNK